MDLWTLAPDGLPPYLPASLFHICPRSSNMILPFLGECLNQSRLLVHLEIDMYLILSMHPLATIIRLLSSTTLGTTTVIWPSILTIPDLALCFPQTLQAAGSQAFLWILQHHAQLPQSLHSPSQPDPTVTNNQDNVPDFTNGKSIAALSMKKHPSFPKCEAALLPWAGPECDPNTKHNEWCSGLELARGSGSIFFCITKGRWPTKQLYREAGNLFKHLI